MYKQCLINRSGRLFKWLILLLFWPWLQLCSQGSKAIEGADGRIELPYTRQLVVQSCFPCHGPRGQSGSPAIPSLAGLPKAYLLEVMRGFRHGGRFGTVMERLMQAYEEDELAAIADYFSQQPPVTPKQTTDWRLVDRGRNLHRVYCRDCHGDPQTPAADGVPQLHGQWMSYLRWTLWDYLVGINQGDDEMAQQLTRLMRGYGPAGIEALLHYYGKGKP